MDGSGAGARGRDGPARAGAAGGYTLVEMMVVMAIIVMLMTVAVVAVNGMLRGSRLNSTVGMLLGAADQARSNALALRCSVGVDVTRQDEQTNEKGILNRLSSIGPNLFETFDAPKLASYWLGSRSAAVEGQGNNWLKLPKGEQIYSTVFALRKVSAEEYEAVIQARVQFQAQERRDGVWTARVMGSLDDTGGGGYALALAVKVKTNRPEMSESFVQVESAGSSLAKLDLPKDMALVAPGVWYRMKLCIKRYNQVGAKGDTDIRRVAKVSGKVWVDGQLEPPGWTVGPVLDEAPRDNGYAGLKAEGATILVDDFFWDLRTLRNVPSGIRIDCYAPDPPEGRVLEASGEDLHSIYSFPLLFRPDGSAAARYVLQLTDSNTGDKRYVVIERETGRARALDVADKDVASKVLELRQPASNTESGGGKR